MHYRHPCGPGAYFFAGRHHRRHGGFGPFGGGFGGPGGRGFRFGRMLGDGDLRLIALALIEKEPRHGYDIIKALEERSGGFYSPSPGVVYPTLTYLEEAGHVEATADGNKKIYSITDSGKAHLSENRERVEALLEQMAAFGEKMERARKWFTRDEFVWEQRERETESEPETEAMKELDQARRRLRALIVAATEGSEEDQRRIAEILRRAADEVLGKGGKG
jgi:DNA-binding PadR family transcriptional regulator